MTGYIIGSNGLIYAPQGGCRITMSELNAVMQVLARGGAYNGVRILRKSSV